MNSSNKLAEVIDSMQGDQESINILGEYLGYTVGKDPIDPNSDLRIYFTDKTDDKSAGVLAILPVPELDENSNTVFVRKLYEKVMEIKQNQLSLDFKVAVIGFVGKQRLVFFPELTGNRDTRLDLTPSTAKIDLYQRNFNYLKNDNISVEEDPFGGGTDIKVNDHAFRRELSSGFLTMVSLYRKKLSEWITASDLKKYLTPLVSDDAKIYISRNDINNLVQNDSYKSVLSTIVDTISLRQLMRRFLEGYYGADSFNVDGIALGVGSGTLDEAIEKAVNVAKNSSEEKVIKKLNRTRTAIGQLDLFEASFTPEEEEATSKVEIKDGKKQYIEDLSKKASEQFRLAYGGDLFAGSIGDVATKIDNELAKLNGVDWVKPYTDTKAGNYSFRFEDLPPEAIEKQYEDSMSQNVQITLNKETQKPEVFFGDDEVAQKNKGAYYTDHRFVDYMIRKTVNVEFNKRYQAIKKAVKDGEVDEIDEAIQHLLDLKIADFTCGGGSFLRGAFIELAEQYNLLNNLDYPQEIRDKYDFLNGSDEAQYNWENYILYHMIYGVDLDYKAIIISSLTLTLSSLENRPKHTKLPQLIGRTLIHRNSLINAVPYYRRKEVFSKYQSDIAKLRKLKFTDFDKFTKLKDKLQAKVIPECGDVSKYASLLEIGAIELDLPEVYFNEDGSVNEKGGMDIVVGNPPWEIWSPNSDEFFSEYDSNFKNLSNKSKKKIREKELMKKFVNLDEKWKNEKEKISYGLKYFRSDNCFRYQKWRVNGKKPTSLLNLYKLALERFTQLAKVTGSFCILVPDNFATDQGATGIRHLVIDNYELKEFLSFANRKKIFRAVDERYKFATLTFVSKSNDKIDYFKAFFYREDLCDLNNESIKLNYPIDFLKQMEPERYAMVEATDQNSFELFKKIRLSFPALITTNLIEFKQGLNKTRKANKFLDISDQIKDCLPLYEGKSINQFIIQPENLKFKVKRQDIVSETNGAYKYYLIALRTVASATNRRSLIATLLPKNVSAINSLMIQDRPENMSIEDKLFILGFLNSYSLDFVLRQLISINVNKIYLQQLPVPQIKDISDSKNIIQIVKELLKENKGYYTDLDDLIPGNEYANKSHDELIAELNARAMIDFNLTRSEVVTLMKTFISKNHTKDVQDETQRILDCYDKLTENK